MKVKNEFIKIKTNKEYVLHNYIYDNYLEAFSKCQYLQETEYGEHEDTLYELEQRKYLGECHIKFDTALEDYKNATVDDFDIHITRSSYEINGNSKGVSITYNYVAKEDLTEYIGKKITAIGFSGPEISACLDTSNYSIYIDEGNIFSVTRKDTISSDAECVGYDYPLHLCPVEMVSGWGEFNVGAEPMARLYSIGLGTQKGIMEEEYILRKDVEAKVIDDYTFGFALKKGAEPSIYPRTNLYAGSNKYPLPSFFIKELLPSLSLQPSTNKYPLKSNIKYIIFKYRLFTMDRYQNIISQDKYYTMNYYDETKGMFEIRNKIERND